MSRNCNLFSTASRRALALLPLFLLLSALSPAQQNKLAVKPIDPLSGKRGAVLNSTLELVVLPGFHVNSDKPHDEFIIPLKLTWDAGVVAAKSIVYPKPEEIKVGTQNLVVFTGTFPVKTSFQVPANAPVGAATLTGKIRYQACNSDMCFRPSIIDVKVPVVIQP